MEVKDTVMEMNDVALIMFENRGYKSGFAAFCVDEEGFLQEGRLIAITQAEISFKAGADAMLEGQRTSALYWGTKGARVTSDFVCDYIMPCAGSIVFIPDELVDKGKG